MRWYKNWQRVLVALSILSSRISYLLWPRWREGPASGVTVLTTVASPKKSSQRSRKNACQRSSHIRPLIHASSSHTYPVGWRIKMSRHGNTRLLISKLSSTPMGSVQKLLSKARRLYWRQSSRPSRRVWRMSIRKFERECGLSFGLSAQSGLRGRKQSRQLWILRLRSNLTR